MFLNQHRNRHNILADIFNKLIMWNSYLWFFFHRVN